MPEHGCMWFFRSVASVGIHSASFACGVAVKWFTVGTTAMIALFARAQALRALGATKPIFLDEDLLVVRAQIPEVVFIFERLA